jgi:hypothetical protein
VSRGRWNTPRALLAQERRFAAPRGIGSNTHSCWRVGDQRCAILYDSSVGAYRCERGTHAYCGPHLKSAVLALSGSRRPRIADACNRGGIKAHHCSRKCLPIATLAHLLCGCAVGRATSCPRKSRRAEKATNICCAWKHRNIKHPQQKGLYRGSKIRVE